MKKTIRVIIEKEIEVEVADHLLTDEMLREFSGYMFHVDTPEEVLQYAAQALAEFDYTPLDGLGRVANYWDREDYKKNAAVVYREVSCEVESEILG